MPVQPVLTMLLLNDIKNDNRATTTQKIRIGLRALPRIGEDEFNYCWGADRDWAAAHISLPVYPLPLPNNNSLGLSREWGNGSL